MDQFEDCEEDLIRQLDENLVIVEDSEEEDYSDNGTEDIYEFIDISRPLTGEQLQKRAPNAQPMSQKRFQPRSTQGYVSKIDLGNDMTHSSGQVVGRKHKDKKDRATVENTIDRTTLQALIKIMKKKLVKEINGCISTGKEANVYHALTFEEISRAIKIFRTSVQVFKNRIKYVADDHRFQKKESLYGNSRAMVYLWAEKEFRNLTRMHKEGMPCPEPYFWDKNVILMSFIGENERPAPLLQNVMMSETLARTLYIECVNLLWDLYHKCGLIHCDFSEYNLLYHDNRVFIIDVSAAIETTLPKAPHFLKQDCLHISKFFESKNVAVMSVQELFDYITNPDITLETREAHLDQIEERVTSRDPKERGEMNKRDAVFLETLTVTGMNDIAYNGDMEKMETQIHTSIYASLLGKKDNISKVPQIAKHFKQCVKENIARNNAPQEAGEEIESSDDDSEEESEEEEVKEEGKEDSLTEKGEKKKKEKVGARPRDESPNSRKLRKQGVKVENKEKRQKKMKKKDKKKLINKAKH